MGYEDYRYRGFRAKSTVLSKLLQYLANALFENISNTSVFVIMRRTLSIIVINSYDK